MLYTVYDNSVFPTIVTKKKGYIPATMDFLVSNVSSAAFPIYINQK